MRLTIKNPHNEYRTTIAKSANVDELVARAKELSLSDWDVVDSSGVIIAQDGWIKTGTYPSYRPHYVSLDHQGNVLSAVPVNAKIFLREDGFYDIA